jgi:hypothetical protein
MSLVSTSPTRRERLAFAIARLLNVLYQCVVRLYFTLCPHEKRERYSASNPRYPYDRR